MQQRLLVPGIVIAAVVLAGCVGQAPAPAPAPITPTATGGDEAGNNTTAPAYQPPVARMQVYDTDGTQAYAATFVGGNATATTGVHGGGDVRFVGSDSTAVDKTATITSWLWDFGDGGRGVGRTTTHAFTDLGGVFKVALTVVDSHGMTDTQVVTLGAHATRVYNQTLSYKGSLQLGTGGNAEQESLDVHKEKLDLPNTVNGYPVVVKGLILNLTPGEMTSDFNVYLLDADGNPVGSGGANGPADVGAPETLTADSSQVHNGTYTLKVELYLGANGTYTIAGEVWYAVVNPLVEAQWPSTSG